MVERQIAGGAEQIGLLIFDRPGRRRENAEEHILRQIGRDLRRRDASEQEAAQLFMMPPEKILKVPHEITRKQ